MKKELFRIFVMAAVVAVLGGMVAGCASDEPVAQKKKSKYEPQPKVDLDEWTYYKPVTVYYQTNNGRSWGQYHNYRVYSKRLTKGTRYVVADVESGRIYDFTDGGTGQYEHTFNNGKETCYFNCHIEDPSRIVHITHQ
ncbi:MAG: hypothetical protein IJL38_05490 [Bacteroidales bacterium]|nr:hypothetical protein [Bacteroidales bacterium]